MKCNIWIEWISARTEWCYGSEPTHPFVSSSSLMTYVDELVHVCVCCVCGGECVVCVCEGGVYFHLLCLFKIVFFLCIAYLALANLAQLEISFHC